MRQRKAKKTLTTVKSTYDSIGEDFARTRQEPIEEFSFYMDYLKPGEFIADIGCGNGRMLKSLRENDPKPPYRYTGIDNSKKMIAIAKTDHPHEKFLIGDLLNIPLPNSSTDTVFVIRAFHHLPDHETRQKALNEIHRILRPNGIAIITVWNLWQKKYRLSVFRAFLRFLYTFGAYGWNDLLIPWGKKHKRYYHAFTPAELADTITKSGFEIEEEFCVKKDRKVPFKNSHDIVIIAKKVTDNN
jgi:ubiquinone/menaquinone biosynthesis C-methylase UbiE